MAHGPSKSIEVFYSYSHKDETLRLELEKQLANLRRQGVITQWYDRNISPGTEWNDEIEKHLNSATVILLLISPDFLNSDYCNNVEVARAIERHNEGSAVVIPVILRPTNWKGSPFSKLQALPTDARPVTTWSNVDEAFLNVANGIEIALRQLSVRTAPQSAMVSNSRLSPLSFIERESAVGFVGRKDRDGNDIIERLRRELAPKNNQITALWGAGGVGKTAIAAEVARSSLVDYEQRVVWISADGRDEFALATLLDEVAIQLGSPELRTFSVDTKKEAIQALVAEAPTLIVLDNFETVSQKEQSHCLDWFRHLAQASSLITTRARIELPVVKNVPIAAMSADEANQFLERLIQQAQYRRTFEGVDRTRLIETAEANPLIIQWVFAQIDLAQDWREVLDELAQGEGDAAHRVFDRSFNLPLLNNGGRAALLALSLFVPSASRSALAEVAALGGDRNKKKFKEAIKHLAALWLIRTTEGGARLTVEGLTRDLARARLTMDQRSIAIRRRFITRFTQFAASNSRTTASDLNALEAERENVLAAIDIAFNTQDWKSAVKTYGAIVNFLDIRGHWDEIVSRSEKIRIAAIEINADAVVQSVAATVATIYAGRGEYEKAEQIYLQVLDRSREGGNAHRVAALLRSLGNLAINRGEMNQARQFYSDSLDIAKSLGKDGAIADALSGLGIVANDRGEIPEARRLFTESLQIAKRLSNPRTIAGVLNNLGLLEHQQGQITQARELYAESLEIEKKLGNQRGLADSLHNLASIAIDQGQIDQARQLYTESLEIEKRLGSPSDVALSLNGLAMVAEFEGQIAEARNLYRESLQIAKTIGAQRVIASTLRHLASLEEAQGYTREAEQFLKNSLEIERRRDNQDGIANSLLQLALLAREQAQTEDARELCKASLEIWTKLDNQHGVAKALRHIGLISEMVGETDEARLLCMQSLEIEKKLGNQVGIATSIDYLASLDYEQGEMTEATRLYSENLEIERRLGNQSGIAHSLNNLATLAKDQARFDEARALYTESYEIQKAIKNQSGIATSLKALGSLWLDANDLSRAHRCFVESLEIFRKIGRQSRIAATLHSMALLAQKKGDAAEARRHYEESLSIRRKLNNPLNIAITLHEYAKLELDENVLERAEILLNESLETLRSLKAKKYIAECLETLGRLKVSVGLVDQARAMYQEALELASEVGSKSRIAHIKHSFALLEEKENDLTEATVLMREALDIYELLRSPEGEKVKADLERIKA